MRDDEQRPRRREQWTLHFVLERDTAFGSGGGTAGLVDTEVEHDSLGLPLVRGRTLKGLLNEECANILYSLGEALRARPAALQPWQAAAGRLFGAPGSHGDAMAALTFGDGRLPNPIREAVREAQRPSRDRLVLDPEMVLTSLTAVRRQTALDRWGAPQEGTLRALRVVLRQTIFEAPLLYRRTFSAQDPDGSAALADDLALLAACVRGWRRGGASRNRGLGKLRATLRDAQGADITDAQFGCFAMALTDPALTSPEEK
ncbi:MAG: hypothetical protein IT329_08025 [Caldilineaceae bacterium]|nr:hypothetical protein [Caldilineaceae bacterium]